MAEKPDTLLDNLIQFINTERELYGDFSVSNTATQTTGSEVKPAVKPEKPEATEKATTAEKPGNSNTSIKETALSLDEKLKACSTLGELKELCAASEKLKTDLENTNLVFGVGNPQSDLMLIGEAPGEQEDIQGEPFVGPAGQLLNKILKAINFERDDVYIANILKHRPPGNRNPKPEERQRSLPYLMRQIDLINPKIILCLGRISGNTLLNREESLKNMRGRFHKFRNIELTVTYHPAALLRKEQWKRPTWEDVQMVRKRYDELGGKPN